MATTWEQRKERLRAEGRAETGQMSPDEAFDRAMEMVETGTVQAMSVLARTPRNFNRRLELEIAQERLDFEKFQADVTNALRGRRQEFRESEAERAQAAREGRAAATQQRFDIAQDYRERQAQERRERNARTQAFREAQAEERARRREDETQRRQRQQLYGAATPSPSAPKFSTATQGVVPTGGGFAPNKEAVAKFIIAATALSAIFAVANDLGKAPTKLPDGVKVPQHLRSLGGVFVAGTVALVVNEVYPAAGLVLGAGIFTLIFLPNVVDENGRMKGPLKKLTQIFATPGATTARQADAAARARAGVVPVPTGPRDRYGNVIPPANVGHRDQYGNPIP